jgi:outer membrane protein assembly factor BamB
MNNMRRLNILSSTVALAFAAALPTHAADWPQYRGPGHDGISSETILKRWPEGGPKVLWKTATSEGFSSLSVSGGKAFTLVRRDIEGAAREVCVALDANSGKELWAAPLAIAKYDGGGDSGTNDNKGGDGPRSTPSVDGGRVYVLDARLGLTCLDAKTGKSIWTRDLAREHDAKNISWQSAASPLVDGDLIFVAGGGPGQALLGIDKKNGHVVWKGQDDKMTHATPVAATIHGTRQVIFFTQSGLVSVAPSTGTVLWRHPFPYRTSTAASPVVAGDVVYCSAGYGVGAGAARITKEGDKFAATELWRKPNQLMNHWSTPVYREGHLYGMFGFKEYGACPLKCVELATGREVWSKEGFGPGNVTLAGGQIVALGDAGQLVLVEASPKAYSETGRVDFLDGKCWSTPVVSNGRIYARSTREAVCVDVSLKTAASR